MIILPLPPPLLSSLSFLSNQIFKKNNLINFINFTYQTQLTQLFVLFTRFFQLFYNKTTLKKNI